MSKSIRDDIIDILKLELPAKIGEINVQKRFVIDTPVYPLITVTEMINSEAARYTTVDGKEQVTNLRYEINAYVRTMKIDEVIYNNNDALEIIMDLIVDIIENKVGLGRAGEIFIKPYELDNTVMRGIRQFSGRIDKFNFIYRR